MLCAFLDLSARVAKNSIQYCNIALGIVSCIKSQSFSFDSIRIAITIHKRETCNC